MFSKILTAAPVLALCLAAGPSWADSIDPEEFSADLAVGESTTIEKTVVISEGGPTDAIIDVHFLIDTSGSMGSEVNAAKAAATEVFTALNNSFGDVHASVGVFSEGAYLTPADDPSNRDNAIVVFGDGLTGNGATFQNEVNNVALSVPDGGFDFPESGYTAVDLAGGELDWRDGSSRFMFVFTDATAKGDLAGAQAALAEDDITLVALAYRGSDFSVQSTYGDQLGAEVFSATASVEGIVDDVTDGILAGFANYDEVTVDGSAGMPLIDVSVVCTDADIGLCDGAFAMGDYDRSEERTFTFDVTFTRLADGPSIFDTVALVDGGVVARERDNFGAEVVPVPAALPLLMTALGGLGFISRRRRRAA
ncbi:MAG: VWA domain-containing protein [Roseobacter sp.]